MNSIEAPPLCNLCQLAMIPSQGIQPCIAHTEEGHTFNGPWQSTAPLIPVWKCPQCGHSISRIAPTPPPAEAESTIPEASLPRALVSDKLPAPPPPAPIVIEDDPGQDQDHASRITHQEVSRETAFQAIPFTWHGVALAPFAIDRESDWLLHRALIGAPYLGLVFEHASAFLADARRILWFCSHDPSAWLTPSAAEDRAVALEQRIRTWGNAHIHPGEQIEATTLAFSIYNRAHTNRALVKPDPHDKRPAGAGN